MDKYYRLNSSASVDDLRKTTDSYSSPSVRMKLSWEHLSYGMFSKYTNEEMQSNNATKKKYVK